MAELVDDGNCHMPATAGKLWTVAILHAVSMNISV